MDSEKRKEKLFNWAHNLKDKKVNSTQTFKEILQYGEINLWPFITVGVCQAILERESKRKISKSNFFLRTHLFPKIEFLSDLSFSILSKSLVKKIPKNSIQLVTIDRYWKQVYDSLTDNSEYTDEFFDSLIKKLKLENESFLTTSETNVLGTRSFLPLKILLQRRKRRPELNHIPLELFWTKKAKDKGKQARKHFKKVWNNIKDTKEFSKLFIFENENLSDYLYPFFKYYFYTTLPRKIKLIEISKNFIKETKPSTIILQNESAGWEQILIYLAKKQKIKTIALQHGIIYHLHEGYFHTKEETKTHPFADLTAVYGPEIKKLLVNENNYPEEKVIAIGQPRYDKIKDYQGPKIREKFRKKYNISKDKKVFLFASQPVEEKVNKELFENVVRILKNFKEFHLVVKMHPSQNDLDLYEKIANDEGISITLLDGTKDTFEAISSCDFFSTMTSTVALEAMMFNKPVFIFNFTNYGGANDWVKENAVINITNLDSGKNEIKKALFDKNYLSNLLKRGEKFLKKYYYKLDGKATERLYDLIKNNINQPKQEF